MNTQAPPPPPPPPPGGNPNFQDPFASTDPSMDVGGGLDQGKPAVAAAPGRVFIVLGIVIVLFTLLIFNLFIIPEDEEVARTDEDVQVAPATVVDPADSLDIGLAPPPPPTPIMPTLPENEAPVITPDDDGPTNELLRQRIRSNMLIVGGGGGLLPDFGTGGDEAGASDDGNLQFASRVYSSNTEARKAYATRIGDLNRVVAQGKIIQGSLETAINTDLPGNIRAIVSRDIFPEAGTHVIIPKGSRLIGQYNSAIMGGQKRVYVVWTRLIRPDGVDVAINSPLIDQIGQAGVAGHVDTKFGEIFSRALLTSVITISIAAIVDEINGNEQFSTTQNTDGSITQSGDATSAATITASQQFGAILSSHLRRFIDVQPTILVDQGTPVNVFVNRDLIFPNSAAGAQMIP